MRKSITFIITSLIILSSCNHHKGTEDKTNAFVNNFIAPKSCIIYAQEMYIPKEYFFFKSIDYPKLVTTLQEKTMRGEITAYLPFSDIVCNKEDIQTKFKDEFSLNEQKSLLFEEEWAFDSAQFIMKKKVTSYSLIREYTRKDEYRGELPTKSIVARYEFKDTSTSKTKKPKLTLLAKDVSYEVPLVNNENPEFLENIQVNQVVKTIIEKAISGTVPCYSFNFRDSLQPRSHNEVLKLLGKETNCYTTVNEETGELDSTCVDKDIDFKEIQGLAFIEDWYLNNATMEIVKEVKGIAPIRQFYHTTDDNTQSELIKTIPFVMYLKNHDKGK